MEKQAKILVVEDEENVRLLISEELQDMGHIVETASNAEEALKKLQEKSFDLVTIDIEMPGMNGIELAGTLRQKFPRIKIILLTAYSHYKYDLASWAADAYIVKSPDLEELKRTVTKLLSM
ncbi:response regulator [Pseudothermotoga thermarum]|uniref:Response regulator receiver protein n=1 Tax=Pseudothermotoga thermarum DSM 5069 TaxID=688269 RepID=F7YVQ0_9THEM|nr:response regulator [Pseudothermotoga thermarum]AEH51715.1 response regulator receiver protein [Pseudothermotoga thermarum DSM 5069]